MIAANRSYWEEELYDVPYQLVVVGGGLVGQSVAYFYKKENPLARVLVVDRGFYPIGASTRNAGFACIGSVTEIMADLNIEDEDIVKERIHRRYEGLLLLRKELGDRHIDYDACGGWEIFTDREAFHEACKHIDQYNTWIYELTGESDTYKAGEKLGKPVIFNRLEGALHSGKMMRALYEKNMSLGVEFRWECSVNTVEDDGLIVLRNGISIRAEQIVISTNAFTKTLLNDIDITPGRGYIMLTNAGVNTEWYGTFHYDDGYIYFRNIGDDRLLLGGARNIDYEGEETSEFGVNEAIKERLIQFGNEVLGLPEGWGIEQEWSGIMGFTPSKSPILKRYNDRVLLATGLSGMGVALGMQLGKEAADLVRI